MWDDYYDYGYSDYSYDYPSYDYSSYSTPSYDYSSYSTPSYDYSSYYSTPSYDYSYSNYTPWTDSSSYSSSNYDPWSSYDYGSSYSSSSYDPWGSSYGSSNYYDPYASQSSDYNSTLDTNTGWGEEPVSQYTAPEVGPSTQTAGPINYSDMNQPQDDFESAWAQTGAGTGTSVSGTPDTFEQDWAQMGAGSGTTVSGAPGAATTQDWITPNSYGSGGAMGPAYPGYGGTAQQSGYGMGSDYGQTTWDWNHPLDSASRSMGMTSGTTGAFGGSTVNYGQQGGYAGTPGFGGGTTPGYGQGGQQKSTGWDWNHPIDSLTNMFTGGGTGTGGTGTGGASGGIFDWLGNNIGGLAAGAAGLYALNKLLDSGDSGGSSSGVSPTAGYGAVGGAIPVKPGTPLATPGVNPGYAIGQNGIQGLPKPPTTPQA